MLNVRMTFKKENEVKYISHLDLNRVAARALNRAKIKVWHTEGFNPHPYIVFGPPLSVGFTADNEIMEFKLLSNISFDKLKEDLNNTLPTGLSINAAYLSETPLKDIAFAQYLIKVEVNNEETESKIKDFFSKESIIVTKKSKKTEKQVDLAKQIKKYKYEMTSDGFLLDLILPCSNSENINPMLVISALQENLRIEFDFVAICRKRFLDDKLNIFK